MISSFYNQINRFAYQLAPFFYQIVYLSMIGTIVGLCVYVIRKCLDKKLAPKWKMTMWMVTLLAFVIPFSIPIYTETTKVVGLTNIIEQVKELPTDTRLEHQSAKGKSKLVPQEELNYEQGNEESYQKAIEERKEKIQKVEWEETIAYLKVLVLDVIFPYIWLLGGIVFLVFYIIKQIQIKKKIGDQKVVDKHILNLLEESKKKLGIHKKVNLVLQDFQSVPCLYGVFHPTILVTKSFLEKEDKIIQYVFMHELAHAKRKDYFMNVIVLMVAIIHWFNPCVWYYFKKIREDMELATDEMVLTHLKEEEIKQYGKTLLQLIEERSMKREATNVVLGITENNENIERRIHMITLRNYFQKHKISIGVITILLIISVLLICLSNVQKEKVVSNKEKLIAFQNTYLGDASSVNNLLMELPYHNYKGIIELKTNERPYRLTIQYTMNGNEEQLEYNSLVLFALIQNLDEICYQFSNGSYVVTRSSYKELTDLDLDSIEEYINQDNIFGEKEAYRMQINENGKKVFIDPQIALKEIKRDAKEGIEAIQKEFHLLPLSSWNYEKYGTYGWQITLDNEEVRKQASKITSFVDIYKNSYQDSLFQPTDQKAYKQIETVSMNEIRKQIEIKTGEGNDIDFVVLPNTWNGGIVDRISFREALWEKYVTNRETPIQMKEGQSIEIDFYMDDPKIVEIKKEINTYMIQAEVMWVNEEAHFKPVEITKKNNKISFTVDFNEKLQDVQDILGNVVYYVITCKWENGNDIELAFAVEIVE